MLLPASATAQTPPPATAPVRVFGYFQTQLARTRVEPDRARDRVFFRRIVLGLHVTATPAWTGQAVADLGPLASSATNRVLLRDAFLQYNGLAHRGITLAVGNQKTPFSRSMLTPAQYRGLIERPFAGEKSFGSPGRFIGLKGEGWQARRTIFWSAAAGSSLQSPDVRQIRVDSIAEADPDWSQGALGGGRVEWHPRGETPRDQRAFGRPLRYTMGAAVWRWRSDHDSVTYATLPGTHADPDRSGGVEVSCGLRGGAVSLDAEYDRIAGRTVDGTVTAGLYRGGEAHLRKLSFEGGYMVRRRLELLGSWDRMAVDAYDAAPRRAAAGVNWYFDRHNVKMQFMHREIENSGGVRAAHAHVTYLQAQVIF